MRKELRQVLRLTIPYALPKRATLAQTYLGTKFAVLGLSVPTIRKIQAEVEQEVNDPLAFWDFVYSNSHHFELLSMALISMQKMKTEFTKKDIKQFERWANRIDNWEHADRLSDILASLHERFPGDLYPVFQKWNRSKNPWLRRLSIVSLFCYAQLRRKYPAFTKVKQLVYPLMNDKDLYVQKGVGWTLRESFNVYPEKTFTYLQNQASNLAPASWQAATEKLSKQQKKILKYHRAH